MTSIALGNYCEIRELGIKNPLGISFPYRRAFECDGVNLSGKTKYPTFMNQPHPKPSNLISGKDCNQLRQKSTFSNLDNS